MTNKLNDDELAAERFRREASSTQLGRHPLLQSDPTTIEAFLAGIQHERQKSLGKILEPPPTTNTGWPYEKKLHERIEELEAEVLRLREHATEHVASMSCQKREFPEAECDQAAINACLEHSGDQIQLTLWMEIFDHGARWAWARAINEETK